MLGFRSFMSSSRSTAALALVAPLAIASLVTRSAAANEAGDESASGVLVDTYETTEGCPNEEVFREQVERRARTRQSRSASLRVEVHVVRDRRDHVGTIFLTDARGERSTRKVNASRCDEVVSALALVAALAVDDAAREAERTAEEPAPPRASPPTATASTAIDAPAASPARSDEPARTFALRAGAHAAAQSGVAPDVVMTVPVFVELGLDHSRAASGVELRFEPSVRALGIFGGSDRKTIGAAAADFAWTSGAVDACPVRIHLGPASLVPCARVEVGVLSASGEQIVPARSDSRLWTALALPIRLRLEPWRHFFVEIEGAARTPLVRDRFVFQPDSKVFEAPPVGWTAAAGAGVRFP